MWSTSKTLMTVLLACLTIIHLPARADDHDLVIITPHNMHIQQEFEWGFADHVGRPVKIRWIKQGTSQLAQLLEAKNRATPGESFDIDVFFGGGVPDHDLAAGRGFLQSPEISSELLAAIPGQVAGVPNHDERRLWFSAAISSFGILTNRRGLDNQKLPSIQSWEDLAEPRMFSWVVIADPRRSASVQVCYEAVLQQHGWEKGWPILMQLAANSRVIADSSSAVPNEIASGNALAGPCIDFYAFARVAQAGKDVLQYVCPTGGTAITPDPISMLRKPPHRRLAEQFINFVLSREGQLLWVLPPGEIGGPREHALHRLPIRPDVYTTHASKILGTSPYEQAESGAFFQLDAEMQKARLLVLSELMGAALVDQHRDLKAAWKAIIDGGMKPAALEEWQKVPFTESESLMLAKTLEGGGREARQLLRTWAGVFREKYKAVRSLAE